MLVSGCLYRHGDIVVDVAAVGKGDTIISMVWMCESGYCVLRVCWWFGGQNWSCFSEYTLRNVYSNYNNVELKKTIGMNYVDNLTDTTDRYYLYNTQYLSNYHI